MPGFRFDADTPPVLYEPAEGVLLKKLTFADSLDMGAGERLRDFPCDRARFDGVVCLGSLAGRRERSGRDVAVDFVGDLAWQIDC